MGGIVADLVRKRALAETQGIRARADTAKTEADLTRAQADLRKAQAALGAPGMNNPKVRQALAALDQARLDLRNTEVRAPADGTVTNLRLATGQYVAPGQPLLSFLERGPRWISADMRENQLGNVEPGQDVMIALDIKPGKLFRGKVHSIGWGISQGDEAPTGQLPTVQPAQGWVREPQRFPVRILILPDEVKKAGIEVGRSGAQANVLIFTEDMSIMNPIPIQNLKSKIQNPAGVRPPAPSLAGPNRPRRSGRAMRTSTRCSVTSTAGREVHPNTFFSIWH